MLTYNYGKIEKWWYKTMINDINLNYRSQFQIQLFDNLVVDYAYPFRDPIEQLSWMYFDIQFYNWTSLFNASL